MQNIKKLLISVLGPTGNHVLFNQITLTDSNNNIFNHVGQIQLGGDVTNSGINGLDTGEAATGNWYYLYVISNGTDMATLYSLSENDPVMPSGYTFRMLVGFCYLQSTGEFYKQLQVGDTIYPKQYQLLMPEPDTTHQNQWINLDISYFLPPNDWSMEAEFYGTHEANYSSPGVRQVYMGLRSGLLFNSDFNLINKEIYQSGHLLESGKTIWITDHEGNRDINWYVASDGPTTYKTRLYLGKYKIQIFSRFD